MRWGFKAEARRLALEVRGEVGLDAYQRFDPYALAGEYGVPVWNFSELGDCDEGRAALAHFAQSSGVLSAMVVPLGTKRLILDNDAHPLVRRRSSISHEMAHILLEHPFSDVVVTADGCRAADTNLEDEVNCLAGELLIPHDAARREALRDSSDVQVATLYDVSEPFARMRMNWSGARRIASLTRARYAKSGKP